MRSLSFVTIISLISCLSATTLRAQDRTVKDIPKLVKKSPRTQTFHFSSFGAGWVDVPYEFVSLKEIDSTLLTPIEKNALLSFSDVAFCFKGNKVHCCYWVKDIDGNTGLVKFDGSILVPPIKGNILQGTHPNRIIIGEQTVNPKEWLNEYHNRVTTFSGRGLGHFAAVVDDIKDEKKIRATIPVGKYDDIMIGIKGTHTYYFVAKHTQVGMKWGIVDKNDKEIMPIEAKGIYKKKGAASWLIGNVGGTWADSETMDMSQIENMVHNEEKIAQQRREHLSRNLIALGSVLEQSANLVGHIQQIKGGVGTAEREGDSGHGGTLERQYKQWENRAKSNYNSLTNLGLQGKKNGKDTGGTTGQGMNSGNYVSMKKSLREAQKEMQKIRMKASKQGIPIKKSEYEDIVVKY